MFLTRFHLDARSRAGAGYLANPQRLHAAIYLALNTRPVTTENGNGRPLWRVDRDDAARPRLWVLSPERPDLDALADEAGCAVGGVIYESKPYEPLLDRLDTGQVYAFRLAANAVHSGRRSPESSHTQRFAHVTASQQLSWLNARAAVHGFELCEGGSGERDAAVVGRRRAVFRRDQQRITVVVSEFAGHLAVSDPDALRRSLEVGIGHARAYGCGLLTLAAPRRR